MRRLLIVVGCLVLGAGLLAQAPPQRAGYAVGFRLGEETRQGLAVDGIGVDLDLVVQGFADGLEDNAPAVDPQQLHTILAAVHREMQDRMVTRLMAEDPAFKKRSDENLARSRAFHDAFGERAGAVTLPDGLQYEVLRPGTGPSPGPTDAVVVSYRMILLDKTEVAKGRAEEIAVSEVLEAAGRILQMMKVGGEWYVAFPPQLAFGTAGRYPEVGPNETILGRIELLAVQGAGP